MGTLLVDVTASGDPVSTFFFSANFLLSHR